MRKTEYEEYLYKQKYGPRDSAAVGRVVVLDLVK